MHTLSHKLPVAVVSAMGVGDGLLAMVIANNLANNGYQVTLYSSALAGLAAWFPRVTIARFPKPEACLDYYAKYRQIIAADHSLVTRFPVLTQRSLVLRRRHFDRKQTTVANFMAICRELTLTNVTASNGLTVPAHYQLQHRLHRKRVIIHPTSTGEHKNWTPGKFLRLARKLRQAGYDPVFTVAPNERSEWLRHTHAEFSMPEFPTLSEAAAFIYESGYMIGNDSGIGHLASNLGIPTLSIFSKFNSAHVWRPGWSHGLVVTPLLPLPDFIHHHWQRLVTVPQVLRAFRRLQTTEQSL
jgi:ADP-heptose:LPS heptosyltransferase